MFFTHHQGPPTSIQLLGDMFGFAHLEILSVVEPRNREDLEMWFLHIHDDDVIRYVCYMIWEMFAIWEVCLP